MSHFVDDLQQQAAQAMAVMQTAARAARQIHARAELMRHMLTTARKVQHERRAEAVAAVVAEWLAAWNLEAMQSPDLARAMQGLTEAFHDYVTAPTDVSDAQLRSTCATLEVAFTDAGTTLADQMAWRSQCAHGWWELVVPTPADLPGRTARPSVPVHAAGTAFWATGCAEFCR